MRSRDIKIWKDPFYRSLPPLYKCLWDYINDDCDNAGVWHVDFKVASICIGRKVKEDLALQHFGQRIIVSPCGHKWYITTFIQEKLAFDPANLNPANKFQKSIIDLLNKHDIEKFKGLTSPLQWAISNREVKVNAEAKAEEGVPGEIDNQSTHQPIDSSTHVIGQKSPWHISIRSTYAGQPPKLIYNLQEYFRQQQQLESLTLAGWTDFDGFMQANPAAMFNDHSHLYNTFRSYHIKAPRKKQPGERADRFAKAAQRVEEILNQKN